MRDGVHMTFLAQVPQGGAAIEHLFEEGVAALEDYAVVETHFFGLGGGVGGWFWGWGLGLM